jgi:hypothetical protein
MKIIQLNIITFISSLLFCASVSAATLYSNGVVDIPTTNRPPTDPIEKFQSTFKKLNLVDKTELCHGYQVRQGLFSDKTYDMYVIRTKAYEKAKDGEYYLYDVYAQFNDDAVTATFIWNAETDEGLSADDRTIKPMYQGICNQSVTVLRTKEQQIAISKADGNYTPVAVKPCQTEKEAFKKIDSQIRFEVAKAELESSAKSAEGMSRNQHDRLNLTIENNSNQARQNVFLQALLAKKLDAEKTLNSCLDSSKKPVSSVESDPLDQLRKLKSLLDDKIITQKEFDTKKAQLLKK